ncbi:MAG: CRISPR-associated helicase Cas3' [Limisphaerales bacterium]
MNRKPTEFWAKTVRDAHGVEVPGISVRDHCLNVGCVAEALIHQMPPALKCVLPAGAANLAASHDIGKVSPGFQQKCPAWMVKNSFPPQPAETDHAKVSQWFLQRWFDIDDARKFKRWLMAVGAHHGQSKGPWIKDDRGGGIALNGTTGEEHWQCTREELADDIAAFFGGLPRGDLLPRTTSPDDAALALFAGLVTVADWIGSDERFFSPRADGPALTPAKRRTLAADAVSAIGFDSTPRVRTVGFAELFPQLGSPNELQTLAADHCARPGLWIIEAPMGCGKTEAALLAASKAIESGDARGIYFALPTQTTSNRIHGRVGDWMENLLQSGATLRLAHGASWLEDKQVLRVRPSARFEDKTDNDQENPWAAQYWFSSARRALLTSFGVGTVDQALLGVVAAKHFFVRLFGLAGKVVVLDEVHSYDLYTGTLLDILVEQLLQLRCTVIVLSATLTRERREQLIVAARRAFSNTAGESSASSLRASSTAYPLLSGVNADGQVIEIPVAEVTASKPVVRLRCLDISFDEAAAECAQRAEAGQVVLWVRDTVDAAQRSLDAVRSTIRQGGPQTVLLHSRFPWFQRDRLERIWLRRLGIGVTKRWRRRFAKETPGLFPTRRGAVIVATQVVEQSVDIDADFLLTDLAPTDMLLQRLGRLWRHDRPNRPNLSAGPEAWIHAPDCSSLEKVAEIKARLKGIAPPYAAYVLLRSAREWQRFATRGGIQLPGNIREILEATYAPWPDEPATWVTLREEMECRAASLRNKAVGAANAWSLPTLRDDEGVQTRFSDYQTAILILLRDCERSRSEVRLTTIEGASVTAYERDWSRDVAAALHRSHVKVPAWWLRERHPEHPAALKHYFGGNPWALTTVAGESLWLDGREDENSGLKYHPGRGVWRDPGAGRPPSPDYNNDDHEFND